METKEVTNERLILVYNSLAYLANKETKAWYIIGKNLKNIQKAVEKFEHNRKSLLDKYAVKEENGNYKLTQDNKYIDFGGKEDVVKEEFVNLAKEIVSIEVDEFPVDKLVEENLEGAKVNPLFGIILKET